MNFRDLEYLVAVARLSHLGKAAEACNVSQSALSLQLQKLEREVGVQLLERTNRRVVVTEAGKEVVKRARELLLGKQELMDAARLFEGSLPDSVRIGAIPTIAPFLFSDLYADLKKKFPATTPRFDEEVTERLEKAIGSGEIDVGILATPITDTLLDEITLFDEPFLLAVPSKHRLTKKTSPITPEDLTSDQLLLLKDTHCLKDQVIQFCTTHRVASLGSHQSAASSISTLLALVRSNLGISLIPRMATGKFTNLTGISCLPVTPPPSRRIRIVFRKTSQVGRRLAEALRQCQSLGDSSDLKTGASEVH